jgi:broad specificity phosphatase PhoE
MGKTIITLVRHAEGYHNLSVDNEKLPDPDLTLFGEAQCRALSATFPSPEKITHLVASPLRRTIYTCLLSFPSAVARGLTVLAVPELQENSDVPSDTGSDLSMLQAEFGTGQFAGIVDLSRVHEGWNSKTGRWCPSAAAIEARARDARLILRNIAQENDDDKEIIVVTHGAFVHFFTENWDGFDDVLGTGWLNTEYRSYEFVDPAGNDARASVIETKESKARRAHARNFVSISQVRGVDQVAKL